MRGCLDRMAVLLAGETLDPRTATKGRGAATDWWNLTVAEVASLRAALVTQATKDGKAWAPAYVNKHLAAIRKVLEQSWLLGLMDADTKDRAIQAARDEKGTREPPGRSIASAELDLILSACDDGTPRGARDGAMIALLYATGLRRFEVAELNQETWSEAGRSFRVVGKRDKERTVPVSETAMAWLNKWLAIRQWSNGPLFCPIRKNDRIVIDRITGQTVRDILDARCRLAGIKPENAPTPHDFRRTVVGDLLDTGEVDLSTAQKLAGHDSPKTTARYDRRGDRALLAAVDKLKIRQPGQEAS